VAIAGGDVQNLRTVDSRRADNVCLDNISVLSTGFEDDFVDVAVECRVRKGGELFDATPVVVFFLGPFAQPVSFAILVSQDACAACVQPVAWVLFGVPGANAFGNGFGGAFVVGGVGGVCGGGW
jgi:hypothetical protein